MRFVADQFRRHFNHNKIMTNVRKWNISHVRKGRSDETRINVELRRAGNKEESHARVDPASGEESVKHVKNSSGIKESDLLIAGHELRWEPHE